MLSEITMKYNYDKGTDHLKFLCVFWEFLSCNIFVRSKNIQRNFLLTSKRKAYCFTNAFQDTSEQVVRRTGISLCRDKEGANFFLKTFPCVT